MSAKWLFTFKHFIFSLLPLLTHSAMIWNKEDIKMKIDHNMGFVRCYDLFSSTVFQTSSFSKNTKKHLKQKTFLPCQFISSFEWRKADFSVLSRGDKSHNCVRIDKQNNVSDSKKN